MVYGFLMVLWSVDFKENDGVNGVLGTDVETAPT